MFDIQNYPQFILAIIVFQLIPGAGTLAIVNASARSGIKMGMAAVAGTLIGDAVYMISAMLGLATVMKANSSLFSALQWFGVIYLVWMAWGLLRADKIENTIDSAKPVSAWLYARQAALVSLTNPKVMLFFVAFFPLFLKVDASISTLIIMMVHVTVICFIYELGLVLIGNWVASKLKGLPMAEVWAKRLAGVSLLGFASKLASNNR